MDKMSSIDIDDIYQFEFVRFIINNDFMMNSFID